MGTDAAKGLTTVDIVKAFAPITGGAHDELIERLIRQTTDEIEEGIGAKIIVAEYTDEIDGPPLGPLILTHRPVVEFRTLLLNDDEVDSATYEVNTEAGLVYYVTDGATTPWTQGTRNYSANYTAGKVKIPGGLEGIATDIVARRVLAVSRKCVGVQGQAPLTSPDG